jgi:UDP-3-O-[3-hydroxymyristoyl] glucosamine N-acyltransferase
LKAGNYNSSSSNSSRKKKMNLGEVARYLNGELSGDATIRITGVAAIEDAQAGDLTFLVNPKYIPFLRTTSASAVIVGQKTEIPKTTIPLIKHLNPYMAFARALELFKGVCPDYPQGIHPTSVLGKDLVVESGVHIGPHVVVEDGTKIGQNSTILAGCFIGADSEIGEKSLIYPNVTIRENVRIGKKVIIHSGAVIGSDGFGFAREGIKHYKIPQVGGVVIEDDVEIGANVTVDRATLGMTRIGRGTKIDNLVQIAHNVNIGENCIIAGQVGISGSTQIGDGSMIGGQVGMVGHIKIGKRVIVGAQSGVTKDVPEGTTIFGYPAREIHKTKRIEAHLSRLDLYVERLKEVEQTLKKIQKNSANS